MRNSQREIITREQSLSDQLKSLASGVARARGRSFPIIHDQPSFQMSREDTLLVDGDQSCAG